MITVTTPVIIVPTDSGSSSLLFAARPTSFDQRRYLSRVSSQPIVVEDEVSLKVVESDDNHLKLMPARDTQKLSLFNHHQMLKLSKSEQDMRSKLQLHSLSLKLDNRDVTFYPSDTLKVKFSCNLNGGSRSRGSSPARGARGDQHLLTIRRDCVLVFDLTFKTQFDPWVNGVVIKFAPADFSNAACTLVVRTGQRADQDNVGHSRVSRSADHLDQQLGDAQREVPSQEERELLSTITLPCSTNSSSSADVSPLGSTPPQNAAGPSANSVRLTAKIPSYVQPGVYRTSVESLQVNQARRSINTVNVLDLSVKII